MIINTIDHMSDGAISFKIKPNKTNPVKNVQELMEKFTEISIKGNSNATTNSEGLVLLYSGKNDDSVISSSDFLLKSLEIKATETVLGVAKFSGTNGHSNSSVDHIVDPKTINEYIDKSRSTINSNGLVKFATNDELNSKKGSSLITPKNIKYFMDQFSPKQETATEAIVGLVKVVDQKTLYGTGKNYHDGYAITPKTFMESKSSETRIGISKFTNNWESTANGGNDIIAPKVLYGLKGTIKGENNKLNRLDTITAKDDAEYNSDVTRIVQELIDEKRINIFNEIMPLGQIIISSDIINTTRVKTLNGQYLNKNTYSGLFSMIGYKYGRKGDDFRLPDTRGLFLKSRGKGDLINGPLGNIKSYETGDFVIQGTAPHKHAGFAYEINKLSGKYSDYKHGLWGTGATKNNNFYGAGYTSFGGYFYWERPPKVNQVVVSQNKPLRYTDTGNMRGNRYRTTPNGESRPWNISLNYAIRAL